jgi:putative ABC transport system permease protein
MPSSRAKASRSARTIITAASISSSLTSTIDGVIYGAGFPLRSIAEDLRCALRALARSPAFALTAVATLAVGIGINAAVFALFKAVLFSGFPSVEDNTSLAYIASRRSACCLSFPDFEDWRAQATSFDDMAVVHGLPVSLSDSSGLPESHDATEISPNAFALVGRQPALGRDFTAADAVPGAAPVAILSYAFWESRYAKDPAIIGRVIRIDRRPTTVVGVMPPGFSFPQRQALWLPLVPTSDVRQRGSRNLWFAFGRLAPGATFETAQAEMRAIGQRLAAQYPETNRDYRPEVRTFNQFFISPNENAIYAAMWGAVAFVLLIVCANLANLMLTRAMGRTREMSVRIALGAGRWRIVRQLVVESLLLSAAGGLVGWGLAKAAVHAYALAERGPGRTPWRILDYSVDGKVLVYLALITIATGVLFGLAPAVRSSRVDINASLRDGDRGTTQGASAKRLSALLVTCQVALAVVLLTGAGLMTRSYLRIASASTGITARNVLTGFIELPRDEYRDNRVRLALYDRLESRLEALPEIDSVAVASVLPTWGASPVPYSLEGEQNAGIDTTQRPRTASLAVGSGYFGTLETPVLAGREFDAADDADGLPVAIVNERFARRHWLGQSALGKRLRLYDGTAPQPWRTVVGVVSDIAQSDATRQTLEPLVYLPHRQTTVGGLWVLIRTRVPPGRLADDFRREVQALDADLPVLLGPYALEQRLTEAYWNSELYAVLFLVFSAVALLLAALGLYAVVEYSVSRHTQEIGIRVAVGATAPDILGLVFRQGMLPLGLGLAIGIAASLGVTRVLKSMLVHVSTTDPLAFAGAVFVLALAAALGCLLPARRALRVDPVAALRHQ